MVELVITHKHLTAKSVRSRDFWLSELVLEGEQFPFSQGRGTSRRRQKYKDTYWLQAQPTLA